MNATIVLQRLRQFLLAIAGLIFLATPVELLLVEHFDSPQQIIPFILCALGVSAVAAALLRPQRRTLLALRWAMLLAILGGAIGAYLHIANNVAFELEIRPNAALGAVLIDALGGASPLLAPGILALAGILAIAATYYHPSLHSQEKQPK